MLPKSGRHRMFDDQVHDYIWTYLDENLKLPTVRGVAQALGVPRPDVLAAILRLRKARRLHRYSLKPYGYSRKIDLNAPHWNMAALAPIKPTKNKGRKRGQEAS